MKFLYVITLYVWDMEIAYTQKNSQIFEKVQITSWSFLLKKKKKKRQKPNMGIIICISITQSCLY